MQLDSPKQSKTVIPKAAEETEGMEKMEFKKGLETKESFEIERNSASLLLEKQPKSPSEGSKSISSFPTADSKHKRVPSMNLDAKPKLVGPIKEDEGSYIFERFTVCKMKVLPASNLPPASIGPQTGANQNSSKKRAGVVRKTFWIYPQPAGVPTAEEKDEADLLTTLCFPQPSAMSADHFEILNPIPFIVQYFAEFREENTAKIFFALNKNSQEKRYQNVYNPQSLRYFFGDTFSDFEKSENGLRVENTRILIMFESKYPFRTFFSNIIKLVFNIIKFRRLSKYGEYFNGDQRDLKNLETVSEYDASKIIQVGLHSSKGTQR